MESLWRLPDDLEDSRESLLPREGRQATPAPSGLIQALLADLGNFAIDFDNLKIMELIASGAGGKVYKGEHCGEKCAIKRLHADFVTSSTAQTLLQRETKILAKLKHPHLVSFVGFCCTKDEFSTSFCIVMELCPISLQDRLEAGERFEGSDMVRYLLQFQQGLHYLHQNKIIHRDLKPGNIMFDDDDNVKIIDFGLARENKKNASTWAGMTVTQGVGTPYFMAPEVLGGGFGNGYGKSCDIYSYGIIAWQFYTGKTSPYPADQYANPFALYEAVRAGARPATIGFPPLFKELVEKCVAHNPKMRCTTLEIEERLQQPLLLKHGAQVFAGPPSDSVQ